MAEKKKYIRRRLPCALHDVDGIEDWLGDMSREGLLLVKNSCVRGRVSFKRIEPHASHYRLTVGARSASALDQGRPLELFLGRDEREYAWYAAGRLGDYYVYRTLDSGGWEPVRDPLARTIALDRVKRRLRFDILLAVVCLVLYPLLLILGRGLVLTAVGAGSWLFLAGLVLILWLLIDSILACRRVKRPKRKTGRRWGRRAAGYYGVAAVQLLAVFCLLGLICAGWLLPWLGVGSTTPAAYTGARPFADLSELAGAPVDSYRLTPPGSSSVREWCDPLSPRNLTWHENGVLRLEDGSLVEAGLYVDYHRAQNEWLAQRMAEEYVQRDRWTRGRQALECSALEADYAAAWCTDPQFSTVVIRRGNVTVRALFYESGEDAPSLDRWAADLAASISEG